MCKSTVNLSICGSCLLVKYCSEQCQQKDWPHHKSECAMIGVGPKRKRVKSTDEKTLAIILKIFNNEFENEDFEGLNAEILNNADAQPSYTPLTAAAAFGSPEMVERFVGKGADVKFRDAGDNTALRRAIFRNAGSVEIDGLTEHNRRLAEQDHIVDFLVGDGFHQQIESKLKANDETLLHSIAKHFRIRHIAKLLSKGADPNARNVWFETPLSLAIQPPMSDKTTIQSTILIDKLLKTGASSHLQDGEGRTPLVKAVLFRSVPFVRVLVANGASVGDVWTVRLAGGAIIMQKTLIELAQTMEATTEEQQRTRDEIIAILRGQYI